MVSETDEILNLPKNLLLNLQSESKLKDLNSKYFFQIEWKSK